jgi:D-sedoheptulose 7-phosphate isomerase
MPVAQYLYGAVSTLKQLDQSQIDRVLDQLRRLRDRDGRLFIIGNGGGAGHASHAAADFRKIARIESYAWGENVSDLTAYVNDCGWEVAIRHWLQDSRCDSIDAIFVLSVGGGGNGVSANLSEAMSWARRQIVPVLGIVGGAGGDVSRLADACIVIPSLSTPHVEGVQAVLWHLLVSELA